MPTAYQPMVAVPANYQQALADDFEGTELDGQVWTDHYSYGDFGGRVHGSELEYYADSNCVVGNGALTLTVSADTSGPGGAPGNPAGLPYLSGMIASDGSTNPPWKFALPQVGSLFVWRFKLYRNTGGFWNAFWLKSGNGSTRVEFDHEIYTGDTLVITPHYWINGVDLGPGPYSYPIPDSISSGDEVEVAWQFDSDQNGPYATAFFNGAGVRSWRNSGACPQLISPNNLLYILTNAQVGPPGSGNVPDPGVLPAKAIVLSNISAYAALPLSAQLSGNPLLSANDLRAQLWWQQWANIQRNQGALLEKLAGNGDAAAANYDGWTPLLRKDYLIDAPEEPLPDPKKIWNNSEPL